MAKRPYIIQCQECFKSVATDNPKQKYHVKCQPKKIRRIYPRLFYYRRGYIHQRDNNQCQHCHKEVDVIKNNYHTHHIDKDINNNNYDNLITFCAKCHKGVESGTIDCPTVKRGKMIDLTPTYREKRQKFLFRGI